LRKIGKKKEDCEMNLSYVLNIVLFLSLCINVNAQSIRVSAPSRVNKGDNFRVEYIIDTQDVDDFRSGIKTTDGYEVIAGPYQSRQSSYQMVNGHTSSSSSLKITYTLCALKEGSYTLPSASAFIKGNRIQSKPVKFTIASGGHSSSNGRESDQATSSSSSYIGANDLFINVTANKHKVKEQEAVLLTYKVFTTVELTQLEGKMPDLKGCHVQEIPLPQQKSFHVEKVNGRNYRAVTWSQYVVYPQTTGTIEIPAITFKGIVVVPNKDVDPLEAFLNGGSSYTEMKKDITAPKVVINVEPLPDKPTNFSGGVGNMDVKWSVDHENLKAGEPLTIRVVVSGTGNLKLITQPVINFPKDFDTYDPKTTDNTHLTVNGIQGNVVTEYLAVPRNKGDYIIPGLEFVYYDISSGSYKTSKTNSLQIHVDNGETGSKSSSIAAISDIRDKTIKGRQDVARQYLMGSSLYYILLLLPFLAFIVLLIIFRKRALAMADTVGQKGKRANKEALRRLRSAKQLMDKGNVSAFYNETLRALWGYVSDKLDIKTESLSRDNIAVELTSAGVDDETVSSFMTALDECELEQYAPGDEIGNMNKTFNAAKIAIINIEEKIKKRRKISRSLTIVLTISFLSMSNIAFSKSELIDSLSYVADSLYEIGDYNQAINAYEQLVKESKTAPAYFKLGCSYYRTGRLAKSLLQYERAKKIKPIDADITFNISYVRGKTVDKLPPTSRFIVREWIDDIASVITPDGWGRLSLLSISLSLILLLIFLFYPHETYRRYAFWISMSLFALFAISVILGLARNHVLTTHNDAIVTEDAIKLYKVPDKKGALGRELHEGAYLRIVDRDKEGWYEINLADGTEAWIEKKGVEEI